MLFIFFSNGNDTLKLDYCYEQVYAKYPLGAQRELNKSSTDLKLNNLDINYLPQINITGQASYQSDVTKIEIGSPLFAPPEINKDQYKIFLDVKQTVFDGGITSSLKDVERNQLLANNQKIEVELYQLKQRVNELFFSILLFQEKKDLIDLKLNTIKGQLDEIESQIKYGVLPVSSRYILEAEILKTDQELYEIESNRIASLNMLGELLDEDFDGNTILELPSTIVTDLNPGNRPEYKLFQLEKKALKSYDDVITSRIIPKLSIFGQGGYGRPGLNFLDNTFQPYYIVGINLSWNPINWNRNDNEIQINRINEKIVDIRKETFDKNLKVSLEKYKTEISKLEGLIEKDNEIIELRNKILSSISSQLQNGIITATDYLTELTSENQAKIMLKTHQVQLVQAKIDFLTLKGN
ncbi:TolC family protein [Bacteroidota bacterium]